MVGVGTTHLKFIVRRLIKFTSPVQSFLGTERYQESPLESRAPWMCLTPSEGLLDSVPVSRSARKLGASGGLGEALAVTVERVPSHWDSDVYAGLSPKVPYDRLLVRKPVDSPLKTPNDGIEKPEAEPPDRRGEKEQSDQKTPPAGRSLEPSNQRSHSESLHDWIANFQRSRILQTTCSLQSGRSPGL